MRTLLRTEAQERARLLEVASYDIDLDLTGEDDFGSTTVVRFSCREPGASSFAELDGTPVEVVLNGRSLGVERDGARIPLPDLQADNVLRVVARCSYSRTGEGLHRFVDPADGLVYLWSQSFLDDAQRQFACFDQPDLKAVFGLQVTAPAGWTVVGNGRGTRDGDRWSDHLAGLVDPLSRALCWSSVYDTVRDAEAPPAVLVETVATNVGVEDDPKVAATLLLQATRAAVAWSADPAQRRRLVDATAAGRAAAMPGSDLQLTWTKAWVTLTDDVAALRRLLDDPPAGLAVDKELRWHVVRRLAVLGAVTEDDLEAELARDTTAAGERHAAYARAARPEAAAKEQAWAAVLHDLTLSNHQTEALAEGFWQHESAELCRPWVEQYFAQVRPMWESRTPQIARRVAAYLYPAVLVEQALLDRTDAFLADDTLPAGLRRIVLERQDELGRAVRARAAEAVGSG